MLFQRKKKPQQSKHPKNPNNNNNKTVLKFWSFIIKGSSSKRISNFPLFCNKPCLPPIRLTGFVENVPACLPAVWVPCCSILTHLYITPKWIGNTGLSLLSWRWKFKWLVLCIFQNQETSLADLACLVLGRQLCFLDNNNQRWREWKLYLKTNREYKIIIMKLRSLLLSMF